MSNNYTTILSDKNYRPDWSINDESNPAYVNNRPFYTADPVETVYVDNVSVTVENTESEASYVVSTDVIQAGAVYKKGAW